MTALRLEHFCLLTPEQYANLLNEPGVRKHMPLSSEVTTDWCAEWMRSKASQWDETGNKGPWSIYRGQTFIGWGGLQPDSQYESGAALVLSQSAWGSGFEAFGLIVRESLRLGVANQVLVEFPLTRRAGVVLERLGFSYLDSAVIEGFEFQRYLANLQELAIRLADRHSLGGDLQFNSQ